MKKIIISAVVVVLLAAAAVLLTVNKNNTASAETVVMSLDDLSNVEPLSQDGADAAAIIDKQNRVESMLSELDWVSSAAVNISVSGDKATAVLDVTREPSPEEIDGAAQLIAMSVDGLEKEDVTILDKNSNVLNS